MILAGKRILVTGGTGSLGKALVRRLLSGEIGTPAKVIVLSRDEAKQHEMRLSYLHKSITTDEVIYTNFQRALEFRIGDVRDYSDVCAALGGVDYVFNAAALKQVPTCEYFPDQAILTNCVGPLNIVRAIREHRYPIDTVVGISTDKAGKPVNVMGMTKALQERIFISGNLMGSETRFLCVRYGNVLASRGSVIPLFLEQIRQGGPVTVTVPEMTRFLLSLEQAVDTVFTAVRLGRPGETFIPRVPSATILDIANALIGNRSIETQITGIRPGEKVHEVLVSEEECTHTFPRQDYLVIDPMLPELRHQPVEASEALGHEYNSADALIGLEAVSDLLRRNQLMPDNGQPAATVELLR